MARSPGANDSFRLGRYVLGERLGAGGFGIVYAGFDDELDRRVAIKFVRSSHADRRAAARLLREARAMAQLSHPNVVCVFDVGTYQGADFDDGWPPELSERGVYIVMEAVEGGSLRDVLSYEVGDWRRALALYVEAGRGLAAAHGHGVLHRDFKPTNVLVGADGRPRVVDFGLARALQGAESSSGEQDWSAVRWSDEGGGVGPQRSSNAEEAGPDHTTAVLRPDGESVDLQRLTVTGVAVGTPAYMAPEQFVGDPVGSWTDQYNFTVALYEAVYGRSPFEASTFNEMRLRKVMGQVVAPPAKSGVPERVRAAILRGIALRPADRWESMEAMLAELESGHSRRSWVWAIVSAVVLVGAGAMGLEEDDRSCADGADRMARIWNPSYRAEVRSGLVATGTEFGVATADKTAAALDAYAEAWQTAWKEACSGTDRVGAGFDVQLRCLDDGLEVTRSVVELLANADAEVAVGGAVVVARLGSPHRCLERDAPQRVAAPPADIGAEVDALQNRLMRISTMILAGRARQVQAALPDVVEEARNLGYGPLLARALVLQGTVALEMGDLDGSQESLRRGYYAAVRAADDRQAALAAAKLVALEGDTRADYQSARAWARHAATHIERGGPFPLVESELELSLGFIAENTGDLSKAVEHYGQAQRLLAPVHGADHMDVALAEQNRGRVLHDMGRRVEGLALLRAALRKADAFLGAEHPHLMAFHSALGSALLAEGDYDEAIEHTRKAMEAVESGFGTMHLDYPGQASNYANALMMVGRYDEALEIYESALAAGRAVYEPNHPVVGTVLSNMGQIRLVLGEPEQARRALEGALAIFSARYGDRHRNTAEAINGIGRSLMQMGDYDGSRRRHLEALAILEQTLGPEHLEVARCLHDIGLTYLEAGRPAESIDPLSRALQIRQGRSIDPLFVAESKFALSRAMFGTPDSSDDSTALGYAEQASRLLDQTGPAGDLFRADLDALLREHRR